MVCPEPLLKIILIDQIMVPHLDLDLNLNPLKTEQTNPNLPIMVLVNLNHLLITELVSLSLLPIMAQLLAANKDLIKINQLHLI